MRREKGGPLGVSSLRSRVLGTLALALGALTFVPAGSAQELPSGTGVVMTFRGLATGTGGAVLAKPRRFAPVGVVLENKGPKDVDGLLRVYRGQEVAKGSGPSAVPDQSLFYERPIRLPRNARRTETVYYCCQDREPADRLCVAFESAGNDPVVLFPKLDMKTDASLVLSISSNETDDAAKLGGGSLPGPKRPYEVVMKRADLQALPDRCDGYAPYDLVVVSDLDPSGLSAEQLQALKNFVLGGGDLLVAFSVKSADGPLSFDDSLLPVKAAASGLPTEERDVRPIQALAPGVLEPIERPTVQTKRVVPLPGTNVLVGTADAPLVVRGRVGAGRVTYVAFPLSAVASWQGNRALLGLALRPPGEELETGRSPAAPPLEETLLNLTEALRTLEPPSTLLIGPLLTLYVALVGPLNFLLLSRLGKRSWSYATAAAVALVFGGLFYLVGWAYKGSHALVARAAIIELSSSPALPSRIESLTGFFSTERGNVDGKAAAGSSIAPVAERQLGRAGRVVEPVGADFALKAVELDTWALRRFRSIRVAPCGAVTADLHYEGSHIVGKVTNLTNPPQTLLAPTLFVGERCLELEDLAPGKTLEFDTPATDRPEFRLAERLIDKLSREGYGARFEESSATGGDPFDRDPRRRIQAMLVRRAGALNAPPDAVPALLAGVFATDPDGVGLETRAQVDLGRALVITETEIAVSSGDLTLNGLLPRVVAGDGFEANPGLEGGPPKLGLGAKAADGYVVYEWRLPSSPEHPLALKSLDLRWTLAEPPEENTLVCEFWDWQNAHFVPLAYNKANAREGSFPIDKPSQVGRFFEPGTGLVRVAFRSKSTRDVYLEHVWLGASTVTKK